MKLNHIDCQNKDCSICLNDSSLLEDRLLELTKTGNKYDLLGMYNSWLTKNEIPAETEWGWFSKEAFDDKNINGFVKNFKPL